MAGCYLASSRIDHAGKSSPMATRRTSEPEESSLQSEMQASSPALNQNPPRSITACQRCRDQKLKCSRERPVCTRCKRLDTGCVYPSPPKRRGRRLKQRSRHVPGPLTPSQRLEPALVQSSADSHHNDASCPPTSQTHEFVTPRRTVPPSEEWICSPVKGFESIHGLSHSYSTQLSKLDSVKRGVISESNEPPLPSRAIGLSLLEIYYTRIYNSSVLFHKPLLFQNYLDGKLPGILLKAIFALSTLFLSPPDEGNQDSSMATSELKVLSSYGSCGLPWAKSALRESMSLIFEEKSLMVTQALQCLQLYWFGVGDAYAALAYRSCSLLEYNKKIRAAEEEPDVSLEAELQRRCFWACWLSTCIIAAPEPYIKSAWQEAAMIPLPTFINDTSFGYEIILNERMDKNWSAAGIDPQEHLPFPMAAGLLIKIVGVWTKIELLITDSASLSPTEKLDKIQTLSELATLIFDNAKADRNHQSIDSASEDGKLMLFFNSLYHQCQIALHSMVVPVFSSTSVDETMSRGTVRKSAESVISHAHSLKHLLRPYLYSRCDITRVPPLVGYGAFIMAMVLLTTGVSGQARSSRTAPFRRPSESRILSDVQAVLGLLNTLRGHWQALQYPYERLSAALQVKLSATQTDREPATSETGMVTGDPSNRSSAQIDRGSYPVERSRMVGSWVNVQENAAQNTRPLYHAGQHLSNSQPGLGTSEGFPPEVGDIGSDFNEFDDEYARSLFLTPSSEMQDATWYSLSFAEAGIDQFAGYEPLSLFQEGWRAFS